ncbi:MAG: cytochrome c-type biogenesis protein CcmH, partial [Dehalococcoidia bacterium]
MLRWMLPSALLLALILTAWPLATSADEPPTVHNVASGLMCQCGCAMTVAACQESMPCSVADSIVQQIQSQINDGKSKSEILESFVTIYGESVLAMPRKSGFGLTAWVTPFLAIAAGGVVVTLTMW